MIDRQKFIHPSSLASGAIAADLKFRKRKTELRAELETWMENQNDPFHTFKTVPGKRRMEEHPERPGRTRRKEAAGKAEEVIIDRR
jgi:hypothetical protein